jgi:malate permease and related proteins
MLLLCSSVPLFLCSSAPLLLCPVLDYPTILTAILPVYLIMLLGGCARRWGLLPAAADAGLMRLSVSLLFPCLILERMVGNEALMSVSRVAVAAGLGFGLVAVGIFISYHAAPLIGLSVGEGRRTFAVTTGMQNYGFVAIPVVTSLFAGQEILGVLFTFTLGVELAVWLLGVGTLTGLAKAPWKAALNAPVIVIVLALLMNFSGLSTHFVAGLKAVAGVFAGLGVNAEVVAKDVPLVLHTLLSTLGNCSVPLSVLLIGASIGDLVGREPVLWSVALASPVLRLAIIPCAFLAVASVSSLSLELRRILVVQAAMPSAMFGIVIARMYGGHAATAVQVVLSTTLVSLVTTPLVIAFAVQWLGIGG